MSKIRILVDSPSDLPLEVAREHNILVIPVNLSFDSVTLYRDKYDITAEDFYQKLRSTDVIPKTTLITPIEFEEVFREQAKEYDELIVMTIASTASGTFQAAVTAKQAVEEDLPVKIHLVDSMSLSYGYAYVALEGANWLKQGKSAEEIVQHMQETIANLNTYFAVETLDYLKKGGRIRTTTAIIGGMLDIRPILQVKEGLVSAIDKVRGEKKVFPKFIEIMKQNISDVEHTKIYILNSDVPDKAEELSDLIEKEVGKRPDGIQQVGPVIGCHAGPGVIGVLFILNQMD